MKELNETFKNIGFADVFFQRYSFDFMNSVYLTGSSGFVGQYFMNYLSADNRFNLYHKESEVKISEYAVIHLAGKAHDIKKTTSFEEYYQNNTTLTQRVFDAFLESDAKVFIAISSVKAVADKVEGELSEETMPRPVTHYGKSKLLAEEYILRRKLPSNKRVYILRPCMIHGPGNKGNLNLLFSLISKGIPWPLGAYENKRSFCSIENLCYIIKELIEREDIPSGVYNIADNGTISTNDLVRLTAESLNKKSCIINFPRSFIEGIASIGDFFGLALNTERLQKLTENYVVNNSKIIQAIGKPLPVSAREGLLKTFQSFNS